jgi:hypothetical protein
MDIFIVKSGIIIARPQTNFPASSYERVMPILQAHSEEQLVGAIRKDSQLALRRTSK